MKKNSCLILFRVLICLVMARSFRIERGLVGYPIFLAVNGHTRLLVRCDPLDDYKQLLKELQAYDSTLLDKLRLLVANRIAIYRNLGQP